MNDYFGHQRTDAEARALRQRTNAEMGLDFLLRARDCFNASDNQRTTEAVRHSISSARGAIRICEYRIARAAGRKVVK